jgi:hypothetical protein
MSNHWHCVRILPTDYTDYGGKVKRWEEVEGYYPDCNDCKYFNRLHDKETNRADSDWGVCINPRSPRKGLLTWEHQAGFGCHVSG